MAGENIENLHPAAAIFLNEVAGDIATENERFREDVSRLLPLLDYKQKVHLHATTNEEPAVVQMFRMDGDDANAPPLRKEIISTVKLTEGVISDHGDGQSLIIPVSTSKILFVENLISWAGGIGLTMANDVLGWFPTSIERVFNGYSSPNIADSVTVDLTEEDDVALLTFFVSERACVKGELQGLSRDEIVEVREGLEKGCLSPHFGGLPFVPLGENGAPINLPTPTFKPTSIVFEITPRLRETLCLIGNATISDSIVSEEINESPLDRLRRTTIAALGDEKLKLALKESKALKLQQDALVGIREEIMRGEISHPDGILSFSLEEGRAETAEGGRSVWCVEVANKEKSSMAVASIKHSAFFLSGSQSNYVDLRRARIVSNDDYPIWAMRIPYTSDVDVLGVFNWQDLDEGERSHIVNDFFRKFRAAMTNMTLADGTAVPTFPPTFKLRLTEVRFDKEAIKRTLEMVGLSDV